MKIPLSTVIETKRCRLRVVGRTDFPHVWSATRYKGFNDGMTWDPPSKMEELEEPYRRNIESWKKGTEYSFGIDNKETGEFIGRVGIKKEKPYATWSIGYWIHPDKQRNGYAKECAAAIVAFGFTKLNAKTITSAHAVWNHASKRVIESLGMKFVRENSEGFIKNGEAVAEYEYEINCKDWAALKE
ncbi:GNAT family N-acetyltransferase [Patescibacteria group bacterium]|nr:GNAT family N-acetyltransferase [Patescibacteria group bacterium]MBU1015631.1 GNAT family N-acetyltransferase [Patescibacteria group bacterium]MBU1684992.1 GNAT family N-acetyltransferase [Patescibacteria group bacterium]MBU1938534.1 GNAT family N-acetyltransferase [Patescibacteria group bacterium]